MLQYLVLLCFLELFLVEVNVLEEYNDYELVALAKEGNEESIDLIFHKYKPIIVTKSKDAIVTASHHGIEINDIIREIRE